MYNRKELKRRWNKRNKKQVLEYNRQWLLSNPDKAQKYRERRRERNSNPKYRKILKEQNGTCAICKHPETTQRYKVLASDHSHITGEWRGLLCTKCNTAIGLVLEDVGILKEMILYLQKYKATPIPRSKEEQKKRKSSRVGLWKS